MPNLTSDTITEGIRIQVFPEYISEQSEPDNEQYLFGYKIIISNEGDSWAKLLSRKWNIINSEGDVEEVEGPGVIGYSPVLAPGETFEYSSFCPLDTHWGTMEGSYIMKRRDGSTFEAKIGRFYLAALELV